MEEVRAHPGMAEPEEYLCSLETERMKIYDVRSKTRDRRLAEC